MVRCMFKPTRTLLGMTVFSWISLVVDMLFCQIKNVDLLLGGFESDSFHQC